MSLKFPTRNHLGISSGRVQILSCPVDRQQRAIECKAFYHAKQKWDGIPPTTILDGSILLKWPPANYKTFSPDQNQHAWKIAVIYILSRTGSIRLFSWQKLSFVTLHLPCSCWAFHAQKARPMKETYDFVIIKQSMTFQCSVQKSAAGEIPGHAHNTLILLWTGLYELSKKHNGNLRRPLKL